MTEPSLQIGDWFSEGTDENGAEWTMTGLTGWIEPPPARSSFPSRTVGDGAYDADVFDDSRVLTWTGSVTAPDRLTLALAQRQLGRISRLLKAGATVTGHMPDQDYTVTSKRTSGWQAAAIGPYAFSYQAIVTCVDPYKYGPDVTVGPIQLPSPGSGGLAYPLFQGTGKLEYGSPGTSGQLTLTNPGTVEAAPVFTVTGPVLGGVILTDVDTGRSLVWANDVPGGATLLVIDSAFGRATLNGSDRTGDLIVKQWWSVPPDDGSSTVQFSTLGASGQAGTLTASLRPPHE